MKISVIVPVYNVEQYLEQCLDSIILQDYNNLEIIVVNDGSTDTSGQICDRYAQKDNRIKVIHQENQGLSGARNTGLTHSTGELISFIDSDDWIEQGMYSTISKNFTDEIDIALIPYPTPKNNLPTIYKLNKKQIEKKFISKFIGQTKISLNKTMTSVWSLCIRKQLVEDLSFEKVTYEDVPYFIESMLRAQNIVVICQKYYNYRINPNSISRKYNLNYAHDWSIIHQKIKEILLKYNIYSPKIKNRHQNTIICIYYHLIKNESLNKELVIPNTSLKQYYLDNKIDELLSWPKTIKAILSKPKILVIKLGYSNHILKNRWNKYHKA